MRPRDSWTIFHVGSIPVRIHFTWLLIAAYLVMAFSGQFTQLARAADVADLSLALPPWAWGLLLTVALFACVLLHELAHVAVALRGGAHVRAITLMMLGGFAEISEVDRPRLERWMAAAGPALSLVLAALFWLGFRASAGAAADLRFGLFYLAQVNLAIGLFNLLPAFPMDGGRILRSLLVRRFGMVRATAVAARVGKFIAAGLFLLGLLNGGLWLMLIAVFIFFGGEGESRALQARAAVRGLRVADLFQRRLAVVPSDGTLADAARAMLAQRLDDSVVVAGDRPVGMVSARMVAAVPVRERERVGVLQVSQPAIIVTAHGDAEAALRTLDEDRVDAVVVEEDGRLVGMLSREDLIRGIALRDLAESPTPA